MNKSRKKIGQGITLLEPFDPTPDEELSAMTEDLTDVTFLFSATECRSAPTKKKKFCVFWIACVRCGSI